MVSEEEKASFFSLLKKFSDAIGVSGYEFEIRRLIVEEVGELADKIWTDKLGNIVALKEGESSNAPKLMVAAHIDEIGLIVSHIDSRGFLRFTGVGGWNERILPGQRVIVVTSKGRLRGVIGMKPPHIMTPEEKKQVLEMDKLFVDIGVSSREEAEKLGVNVGSVIVFDREVARLGGGDKVTGKAFDDRVGVAALAYMLKLLRNEPLEANVYAVFTVQEEIGLKGARVSAFSISPDVGVAVDVTIANDIAGVEEKDWITQLGKGPAIKIMDRGNISHPKVRELLIRVAEKEKIPYQLEVLTGGATDAAAIQLAREGIPVGTVSIPTRYIHSPIEVLDLNDAVNASKLLAAFAKEVTKEWVNELSKW